MALRAGLAPLALLSLLTTVHGWRFEAVGGSRHARGASRWPAAPRSAPARSFAILVDRAVRRVARPPRCVVAAPLRARLACDTGPGGRAARPCEDELNSSDSD
jgi:hypothetical protein